MGAFGRFHPGVIGNGKEQGAGRLGLWLPGIVWIRGRSKRVCRGQGGPGRRRRSGVQVFGDGLGAGTHAQLGVEPLDARVDRALGGGNK